MSTIDIDSLLTELTPAQPCGPNLEYDPVFVALELEVLGKPEVQYGETITAAVPPDWKAVRRMATELIARSRDLRLAVHLLRANLVLSGFAGLADGLRLIERLLAERWDSVHPELDADDDNDPMLRINSLAILADMGTVIRDVKEATLLVLPALGPLNLRSFEIANGEIAPPAGQEKITMDSIERALGDVAEDKVATALDMISRALASAVNIETELVRQVGSSQALNLDALTKPLKRGRDFLAAHGGGAQQDDGAAVGDDQAGAGETASASTAAGTGRGAPISGAINDRNDVVRMLDKLIDYYRKHEPSSPIPLLLERAKRLVPKNFVEIMEDLAPEGLAQLMVIKGSDGTVQEESY